NVLIGSPEPCAPTPQYQPPLRCGDQTIVHPFMGIYGLPFDLDLVQDVSEDSRPGSWSTQGDSTAPLPWDSSSGSSGSLEVLPIRPEPMAIGGAGIGDTPGASPHLTASTPGLGDNMSSCAASPVVPNTPTTGPLPQAMVPKQRYEAASPTRQRRVRKSQKAPKHTSLYRCLHQGCGGKTFTSRSAMVRHENENHLAGEVTLYFCSDKQCPRSRKGFPRRHNLMVHMNGRKHR
ncbi:unnamed protein product, partial [Tuber aestivum]